MKAKIWTSLKNRKNEIRFIGIIMLFGLITGIIFYLKQDNSIKSSLSLDMISVFSNNVFSMKNIFLHLIVITLLILSSFLAVGLIFTIIFIFIEGLAVGFLIPLFISSFKLTGVWVFLIYFIFTKLIYFGLLIGLFIAILKFVKIFVLHLKNRTLKWHYAFKMVLLFALLILLNDILIYFVANKIITFILV